MIVACKNGVSSCMEESSAIYSWKTWSSLDPRFLCVHADTWKSELHVLNGMFYY